MATKAMTMPVLGGGLHRFAPEAVDGCVALMRALAEVPEAHRLDATAMFVDVACKTKWLTDRGQDD